MKTGIHPTSHNVTFICSCWNNYSILSTVPDDEVRVEICSNCHPFYTGEKRILKTGAVDKFYARQKKMEEMQKKTETSTEKSSSSSTKKDSTSAKATDDKPAKKTSSKKSEIKAEEVVIVDTKGKAKVEEEVVKETGDKEEVVVTAQEVDKKEAQGETIEEIVE